MTSIAQECIIYLVHLVYFSFKKIKCQQVLKISFSAEEKNMNFVSDAVGANRVLQESTHSACRTVV